MNYDDAFEGAAQFSDGGAWESPAPSFSRAELLIVQRVFKKFCNLRDTKQIHYIITRGLVATFSHGLD